MTGIRSIMGCCCGGGTPVFPFMFLQRNQQRPIIATAQGDKVFTDGPHDYENEDPLINYVTRYHFDNAEPIGFGGSSFLWE